MMLFCFIPISSPFCGKKVAGIQLSVHIALCSLFLFIKDNQGFRILPYSVFLHYKTGFNVLILYPGLPQSKIGGTARKGIPPMIPNKPDKITKSFPSPPFEL
jgi:hypothetical protein